MSSIQYSEKYFDDTYEYRHVVLPPEVAQLLLKDRLLSESEWRGIGVVRMARDWGTTIQGLDPLCYPPARASHHALLRTIELRTAVAEWRSIATAAAAKQARSRFPTMYEHFFTFYEQNSNLFPVYMHIQEFKS
ncbi:unnamed protein product [Calypogeia fissa]